MLAVLRINTLRKNLILAIVSLLNNRRYRDF